MDDIEIDRTLRATLSEQPAPEFVARVRTALADSPRSSLFAGMWKPVVALACVALLAVAIGLRQDVRLEPGPTELAPITAGLKASTTSAPYMTEAVTRPSVAVPTFPPAAALAIAGRLAQSTKPPMPAAPIEPPMPEVLIAQKDIDALRDFIASANEVRFTASFDETPAPTPWLITELPRTETHNN